MVVVPETLVLNIKIVNRPIVKTGYVIANVGNLKTNLSRVGK